MKKLICIFLALLFLAGCGARTAEEPEEELIVVGVCQVGAESDWRVANTESMKAVFTETGGYRLLFDDAKQKQENQISAVRKFIQQQVDYIVVMPISEVGWTGVLQEAKEAGIPVILVDRMVEVEDDSLFAAWVGADFRAEGERAVQWMEQNYADAETVNIIHIQGTLGSTAQLGRTAALEEAVEKHESWQILAQLDGDFTQAKTHEILGQYLAEQTQRPQIDVVYCENDNEAFGAIQILEEHGYTCGPNGVAVISFDATYHALELCRDGKIAFVGECNPLLGEMAASVIQTIESGGSAQKYQYVQEQGFTKTDITDELLQSRQY